MLTSEPTALQLKTEAAHHIRQRTELLNDIPDLDDETLSDTLEGLTDLNEMIREILRSALFDEALIAGLKARVKDMKARLERLGTRAKEKRSLASQVMRDTNLTKLVDAEFTAFLRKGGVKLLVEDETKVPEDYWIAQPAKLDRQGLLQVLKTDKTVPGAHLVESEMQLSLRVK